MYIYLFFSVLVLLLILYMHFETRMLKVEKYKLNNKKNNIKIAQLSDIHIGSMFVSFKKIKDVLTKQDPDIVILSGDYIENEKQIPKFLNLLTSLPDKPTYACFGNHDHKAFLKDNAGLTMFAEEIEKKGVIMLRNKSAVLTVKGQTINIVGIEDIRYKKDNTKKAFSGVDLTKTTIAFSHNPDIVFSLGSNKPDLLLTGHFHGGQIWSPFHLEFKLLRNEKLSKMKIYKGFNSVNNIDIYISRGLGNVVFPLRFLSRPEIAIFEF